MLERAAEVPSRVSLDASSGQPLHRQPYEGVRAGFRRGRGDLLLRYRPSGRWRQRLAAALE